MKIQAIKGETTEQHEKNLRVIERFMIAHDNDGHQYVIPLAKRTEFYEWLADEERSTYSECEKYNEYRVEGGLLTFTDPKVG